jgi:hypothetical protein
LLTNISFAKQEQSIGSFWKKTQPLLYDRDNDKRSSTLELLIQLIQLVNALPKTGQHQTVKTLNPVITDVRHEFCLFFLFLPLKDILICFFDSFFEASPPTEPPCQVAVATNWLTSMHGLQEKKAQEMDGVSRASGDSFLSHFFPFYKITASLDKS